MFDLQINQTSSVVSLIYCDFRIWNAKEMLQQSAQRPSSDTLVRRTAGGYHECRHGLQIVCKAIPPVSIGLAIDFVTYVWSL